MDTVFLESKFFPASQKNNSTMFKPRMRTSENATTRKLRSNYYKIVKNEQRKRYNINKLKDFLKLEENWNSNQAAVFDEDLINKALEIISVIPVQPDVFPTARQSIQMEYEKENGDYLEFEIFKDHIDMLLMNKEQGEKEEQFTVRAFHKINSRIQDFHEGNI
ncbi:hypothetical protein WMZ97_17480 [Lentibacillus sp. N15]|uniref:hypothetical protein n=1 Tax=Lentibacillus songyuanensis TaxID=3136161 RepID=UPI0031B9FE30